jgi:hypothetical protein
VAWQPLPLPPPHGPALEVGRVRRRAQVRAVGAEPASHTLHFHLRKNLGRGAGPLRGGEVELESQGSAMAFGWLRGRETGL